jgi:DUF438 domain-containing protein
MDKLELFEAFMDSLKDPFVFVDNEHIIRYMNNAAFGHHEKAESLPGSSIFDCHNDESNVVINSIYQKMQNGLDEELITDNEKFRIYMRAVRDKNGELLGYFERYEPPVKK